MAFGVVGSVGVVDVAGAGFEQPLSFVKCADPIRITAQDQAAVRHR